MGLKFQNFNFNILFKISFWNKQKWLNKGLIIWSMLARYKGSLFGRKALKNNKFHLQGNFWLQGTEPPCIHHLQPAR